MKAREISKKLLSWSILLLCWFLTSGTFAQQNFILLGKEYRFENGKWYSYFDGNPGDEIIPQRLISRLINRGYLEFFDFETIGIRGVSLKSNRVFDGYYVLEISFKEDPFQVASSLEASGMFDVLEFDAIGKDASDPNDFYFSQQWNLDSSKLRMVKAWDVSAGNSSIILAIIDTGFLWSHEDIVGNLWQNLGEDADQDGKTVESINGTWQFDPGDLNGNDGDSNGRIDDLIGWDTFSNDNDPAVGYHGTVVSGIASARTHNSVGLAGVAGGWQNNKGASLMVIRDGDNVGPNLSALVQGIEYAMNNGAKIINLSVVYDQDFTSLRDAISNAIGNDIIVVCSAGNKGGDTGGAERILRYPARYAATLSVGATMQDDSRWNTPDKAGSCVGDEENFILLDVVAPGAPASIWTTSSSGGYTQEGQTSIAAPHAAGLAALIRSVNSNLNQGQVGDIIRDSADKVAGMNGNMYTDEYGYGRLNAYQALLLTHAYSNKSVSSTATASNNGRRMVKTSDGRYHLVFESGITSNGQVLSEIFYRRSNVGGTSWDPPVRLSAGNEQNRYASIAERSGKLYVVWQRQTTTSNPFNYDIHYAYSGDGGMTWPTKYVLASASFSSATDPFPVIQAGIPGTNTLMVVFRSGSAGLSSRYVNNNNPPQSSSWSTYQVTSSTAARNPSMAYRSNDFAYFQTTWDNGSHVYYRKFFGTNWSSESTVSLNSSANTHEYSSFAVGSTNNRHIVWQATDPSQGNRKVILHNLELNTTIYTKFYSTTTNYLRPSISGFAGGGAVVLWHDQSTAKNIRYARFNGSYWEGSSAGTVYGTNGIDASCAVMNPPAAPIKAVWRSAGSSPYTLSLGSNLQKSAEVELIVYSRQLIYSLDDSSVLALRIFAPQITGENKVLEFPAVANSDSLIAESLAEKLTFDFVVPAIAEEAKVDVEVYATDAARLLQRGAPALQVGFELIEVANSLRVALATVDDIALSNETIAKKSLLLPLDAVRGKMVRLRPVLVGLDLDKVRGALVHEYGAFESNVAPGNVLAGPNFTTAQEFSVGAHPNPFNPSTTIQFNLPTESLVTLRIYNLRGQMVRELLREERVAGAHSVIWDGRDGRGIAAASGVYFVRFENGGNLKVKKLTLVR